MQIRAALLFLLGNAATMAYATPAEPVPEDVADLQVRASCESGGGACVRYFSDGGCTGELELGNYQPTCDGNCFQFSSFSSIEIESSVIFGTDCIAYSDTNCQNEITDSGNQHGEHCMTNLNGAQSMICYYKC
ncbi:hypothetical protein BDY21DRAFT_380787 [Lineolata rhizophorae]|uniref:Uncharacterized protein n=1 Tax=Lineolata rhizophorae TaxID=578093 RepID=A0A6A6NUS6_9PEZI|nr:hypothetical protein BDY21DRAFT_380787 [Lineolata rhizophorae]